MVSRLFLLSALTLAACEPSTSTLKNTETRTFALNDLAILLPYNSVPGLIHSSPQIQPEFVSVELLKNISTQLIDDRKIHVEENFAFGRTGDEVFESDITNVAKDTPYRLVSVRVDPCVNELQDSLPCEANVRLVFQPLLMEGEKVFAKDSNIHAIYKLSAEDFQLFTTQLKNLRKDKPGKDEALLPHPVIASEGVNSPYFKGLVTLLKQNLSVKNLKRIAFFGDTDPNNQGHWPMVAFNVQDGNAVPTKLDQLGKQEGEIQKNVQRLHGNHEHLEDPLPKSTIADTLFPPINLKGDEEPELMQKLISEFMVTKYKNSIRVDNPTLHDPMTADCASCHVAAIQRFQIAPEMNAMGIEIPQGETFTSPRFNLQSNVTPEFSRISLQIFSYFRTEPKVAPRVVNDTARSADILNGDVVLERKAP